jgi:hypothetical protein
MLQKMLNGNDISEIYMLLVASFLALLYAVVNFSALGPEVMLKIVTR